MLNKKGAMFGLDARIALAIFGALSVISGAALYSAIQEAKTTSMITEIEEVVKSFESFYIDTGSVLPYSQSSSPFHTFNHGALLHNNAGISNWRGPYRSDMLHKYGSQGISSSYFLTTYNNFTGSSPNLATAACSSGDCYLWVYVDFMDSTDLSKLLDTKYDDGVSTTGNIRYGSSSPTRNYLYYKSIPMPNPN
jgi:hypothetical protein